MDWSKYIGGILFGEYVPPCEREPYYDDPRDTKPGQQDAFADAVKEYFERNVYGSNDIRTDLEKTKIMCECSKCGTFFIPEGSESLCHSCREWS